MNRVRSLCIIGAFLCAGSAGYGGTPSPASGLEMAKSASTALVSSSSTTTGAASASAAAATPLPTPSPTPLPAAANESPAQIKSLAVLAGPATATAPMTKEAADKAGTLSTNVLKISETLYTGRLGPDLYAVMERIDDAVPNAKARQWWWGSYTKEDDAGHKDYRKLWADKKLPKKPGFPLFTEIGHSLSAGQGSFEFSLQYYHTHNELWIGFISVKPIHTLDDIQMDFIEMAFNIMTDPDAPMTTHMGIGRSFNYLVKAIKDMATPRPVHGNISMQLHSFASRIMKIRDPKKVYMITAPVTTMREIMKKALPTHVYVGDSWARAEEILGKLSTSATPPKSSLMKKELKVLDSKLEALKDNLRAGKTPEQKAKWKEAIAEIENKKRSLTCLVPSTCGSD